MGIYGTVYTGVTKKHMVTPAILGNMWISVGYSADRVDGYRFPINGYIGRVVFCLDGFSTNIYHIPHQRFFSLQGQGTTKIILTLALGQPYLHYPRGNMGETRPLWMAWHVTFVCCLYFLMVESVESFIFVCEDRPFQFPRQMKRYRCPSFRLCQQRLATRSAEAGSAAWNLFGSMPRSSKIPVPFESDMLGMKAPSSLPMFASYPLVI